MEEAELVNITEKTFFIIGYDTCLNFDTRANLKQIIDLGKNNVYLVDLGQDLRSGFYQFFKNEDFTRVIENYDGINENCDFMTVRDIFEGIILSKRYPVTAARNLSGLLYFAPKSIIPCADRTQIVDLDNDFISRERSIKEHVSNELYFLNGEDSRDFNNIVFFGGNAYISPLEHFINNLDLNTVTLEFKS